MKANLRIIFREHKILIGIIFVGILLRFIHLGWGLPELYEEATPLNIAQQFWNTDGKGSDFNPHFFNYPALTFYLHFGGQAAVYAVGRIIGVFSNTSDLFASLSSLVLTGRTLTALFDVGTIIVIYLLGTRLGYHRVALFAAAAVALNPLHIMQSHFIQVDTTLTLLSTLAILFIMKWFEKGNRKSFLWAGSVIGAAAASKYTGVFLLLVLLLAYAMRFKTWQEAKKHWNNNTLLYAGVAAAVTFIIFNPYIILNFNEFLEDFSFERYHAAAGHLGIDTSKTTIGYYLGNIIRNYLGWALYIFVFIASFFFFRRRERKGFLLLSYPVIYLLILSTWEMRAERYILPIFPVLILIGAIGLSYCWDAAVIYLTKHGVHFFDVTLNKVIFASALTVLILVQPTISSIKYLSSLGLKDTRTLTKQWINEHIQQGSVIASGPYGVDFPPEQYAMLHIPFLAFESERVAPFYDPRWYENVDLLITSDYDYGRYASELERYKEFLPFYDTIRTRWKLLFEVKPDADKTGPAFWLYSCPDSLRHPAFVSSMFERFGANPESARISNFLKELNNILMKKKEGQKSMQIMEEILKVEVGNVSLRNRLSEMLISEGRYDDALKHLQYSIQFNPNQPKVFAMAGRCLLRLNKLLEAEATLVKALNSDKYLVDAYDDLIELFTITKQNEKLKVALNNYLGIVPKNSSKRVEIEQKLKEVTL